MIIHIQYSFITETLPLQKKALLVKLHLTLSHMARLVADYVWAVIQEYCGQIQCGIHAYAL